MAVYLPNVVARVERNILAQHKEIKTAAETTTPVNFRAAILLLNVAPLFYFFNSEEIELSLFLFLLAIASYIDIVRRWVPDSLLFLLSPIALGFMLLSTSAIAISNSGSI